MPTHEPVMPGEVVDFLLPHPGGVYVDCTVGGGGHTRALLESGATRVVGIDRDAETLAIAQASLGELAGRVDFVHADYRALEAVLDARGLAEVDGIVADLGFSSLQLEGEGRGFSFQRDEPLDMRMDRSGGPSAADLIREATEREIADAIFEYGEERFSRRIARGIVAAREAGGVETTGRLASIVRHAVPQRGRSRIDPATRTFQALRIWVNRELEGLDVFVETACGRLRTGARLVVIAFHSLEDRIVKHTLRRLAPREDPRVRVLTKRPLVPSEAEVGRNPRARSAKLRAAERLAASASA